MGREGTRPTLVGFHVQGGFGMPAFQFWLTNEQNQTEKLPSPRNAKDGDVAEVAGRPAKAVGPAQLSEPLGGAGRHRQNRVFAASPTPAPPCPCGCDRSQAFRVSLEPVRKLAVRPGLGSASVSPLLLLSPPLPPSPQGGHLRSTSCV